MAPEGPQGRDHLTGRPQRRGRESATVTALREAHEEIGLGANERADHGMGRPGRESSVRLGDPAHRRADRGPSLACGRIQPRSSAIFDVALADLLDERNFLEQRWRREGRLGPERRRNLPHLLYGVPGEVIWGATGRVRDRAASRGGKDARRDGARAIARLKIIRAIVGAGRDAQTFHHRAPEVGWRKSKSDLQVSATGCD